MDTTDIDTPAGGELLVLRQVARIVSRDDAAESRIQDILRHLAQAMGLVRARVLLADPDAGEIHIRYAHGLTPAELARGRYRIGEGVSGRVFQTGEAALVANVHDEPGYLARAVPRGTLPPEQIAFVAVPIVQAHLPIGVLAAHRLRNALRPADSDLALLEVVATMIGQILCTEDRPQVRTADTRHDRRSGRSARKGQTQDSAGCDLMLRTAQQWHTTGRLHQATDMYLRVASRHPGGADGLTAKARLLQIARDYESRGASRLALDVLERLQRVLDQGDEGDGRDGGGGRSVRDQGSDPGGEHGGDRGAESTDWDSSFDGTVTPFKTARSRLGTR